MNVLIYGDSNSAACKPSLTMYQKNGIMDFYPNSDCWWYPLTKCDNNVVLNALPGRCVCHENRWLPNRNASETVQNDVCGDFDLVLVMLGTNDLKSEYDFDGRLLMYELRGIITKIKKMCGNPEIVLISPPQIVEGTPITDKYYKGATDKRWQLEWYYQNLSIYNGYHFVSGEKAEVGIDGEHLTKNGHKYIQNAVMEKLNEIGIINQNKEEEL